LTQQRAAVIDYTPAYFTDGYGILKRRTEGITPIMTFLAPFDKYTWLAVFCAMVFVGLLMCTLDKLTGRVRRNTHRRLEVDRHVGECHCPAGMEKMLGGLQRGAKKQCRGKEIETAGTGGIEQGFTLWHIPSRQYAHVAVVSE
jgi:hypothetical protein